MARRAPRGARESRHAVGAWRCICGSGPFAASLPLLDKNQLSASLVLAASRALPRLAGRQEHACGLARKAGPGRIRVLCGGLAHENDGHSDQPQSEQNEHELAQAQERAEHHDGGNGKPRPSHPDR